MTDIYDQATVSTRSRPKAAGHLTAYILLLPGCFNTQPPEGGWLIVAADNDIHLVSTRSRPKAAGKKS